VRLTKYKTTSTKEGMDKVKTPFDRCLKDRSHLSDEPVESPVRSCAKTGPLGTDAQGQDLGRVQPGDRAPGCAERTKLR
jgi:hypothetical protein